MTEVTEENSDIICHGCWRDDGQIEHETVMEEKASVQVGVHLLGRLEEEDEEEKGYEL